MDDQLNDLLVILVLTFPMIIFTIFPGIMVANFLQEKFGISEKSKGIAMWLFTFLVAIGFSSFLRLG